MISFIYNKQVCTKTDWLKSDYLQVPHRTTIMKSFTFSNKRFVMEPFLTQSKAAAQQL